MIEYAHSGTWKEAVELLDKKPELETLLTQKFQLYLRTCADNNAGKTDIATKRLIRFVSEQEKGNKEDFDSDYNSCLLYTSPSPRDRQKSRMPSSA